ncbi:hypothetical protein CRYUN_Cryun34aG0112400 [Craigia yunnanensis]
MEKFPNMQLLNLPTVRSYHSPIVLNSDYKDGLAMKRFKFEAKWLSMEDCEKIVFDI